jgi:tetratricopeptide (TPR) repeat protein
MPAKFMGIQALIAGLLFAGFQAAAEAETPAAQRLDQFQVRLEKVLKVVAQGERGREQHEAGLLPAEQLESTKQTLREATGLLQSLDRDLNREVPLRRRMPPRPGELSGEELFDLQRNVRQQLAQTQRSRARLFESDSDDRRGLLVAAAGMLQTTLTQLGDDELLRTAVQLDLAECQRLMGQFDQSARLASALDHDGVAPAVRLRARCELLRLAIARGNLAAAAQIIDQGRTIKNQSSPDLDLARFEAFLTLARNSNESYQDQAAQAADILEQTDDPRWSRRAGQILTTALPRDKVSNVALLARLADHYYLRGEFAPAIAAYDDAVVRARDKGDQIAAFNLAYKAALIMQQSKEYLAAAKRLRTLSKEMASHSQAPAAHLLAAWNVGQAAREDPPAAATYAELLREHLATWPADRSADQARAWLIKLNESLPKKSGVIDRAGAEALVAAGRVDEALVAYAKLSKENLDSGQIQEGYAALLLKSDDPDRLKLAVDQWRLVANRSRPRTSRWFQARYSMALAHYKLGDRETAAKQLRYLLETPPGLKDTEWEQPFSDLLRKCEAP